MKWVIHSSTRRQDPSVSSVYKHTIRNQCSSIPREDTSAGRARVRAAWTAITLVSWRIAVCQDTPSAAASADTQRPTRPRPSP